MDSFSREQALALLHNSDGAGMLSRLCALRQRLACRSLHTATVPDSDVSATVSSVQTKYLWQLYCRNPRLQLFTPLQGCVLQTEADLQQALPLLLPQAGSGTNAASATAAAAATELSSVHLHISAPADRLALLTDSELSSVCQYLGACHLAPMLSAVVLKAQKEKLLQLLPEAVYAFVLDYGRFALPEALQEHSQTFDQDKIAGVAHYGAALLLQVADSMSSPALQADVRHRLQALYPDFGTAPGTAQPQSVLPEHTEPGQPAEHKEQAQQGTQDSREHSPDSTAQVQKRQLLQLIRHIASECVGIKDSLWTRCLF